MPRWVWGVLVFEILGVFAWACWKQSRGLPLWTWERRVTLTHLLALALVLGLAMAASQKATASEASVSPARGPFP
jgi:hypothetical protein